MVPVKLDVVLVRIRIWDSKMHLGIHEKAGSVLKSVPIAVGTHEWEEILK